METVGALRLQCIRHGLPSSGKKSELLLRLKDGFPRPKASDTIKSIISIDLGIKNCAIAHVQRPQGTLLNWQLYDVNTFGPTGSVKEMAKTGRVFYETAIGKIQSDKTVIVAEKQRHRSGGQPGVLESIFQSILLEMVIAMLAGDRFISVEPKSVAKYYNLPVGYREKKKAVIEHVKSLKLPPEHEEFFKKQKKKDDLADAIMQALAVNAWLG